MDELSDEARNWERVDELLTHDWKLLIGGELADATGGRTFEVVSPITERPIARVPDADVADVERAVALAEQAQPAWAATSAFERAALVNRLADAVDAHATELTLLDAVDGGAPISAMVADVKASAAICRYFAGLVTEMKGYSAPGVGVHFTVQEPYGVIARIIPFNHPILFAVARIAAPLVAGNAVVLKPAEATPLSALYLASIAKDVFPPGILSIVVGDGPDVPRALVRHPAIRRIGFIGSEPTGRAIMRDAAETGVKNVTLELGGKNALIAFPDADPEEVARGVVTGMNFTWSGQSCGSTSRLVVHHDIADAVVDHVVKLIEQRKIGSPLDIATEQGTMVSRPQYDKVLGYIQLALDNGAELRTGGGRPAQFDTGLYIAPTVLDRVAADDRIAQEEIFGPVLSVIRFGDDEDPAEIANSVEYGLTGAVYTNDIRLAHKTAAAIKSGYIWINGSAAHYLGLPFGGYKNSGLGREENLDELLSYTQTKAIHVL